MSGNCLHVCKENRRIFKPSSSKQISCVRAWLMLSKYFEVFSEAFFIGFRKNCTTAVIFIDNTIRRTKCKREKRKILDD